MFLQQLALLRDFDIGVMDPLGDTFIHTVEPTEARLGVIGADTCHLDVIDRDGNMVSATPSGGWLQSSPVIPVLGFCMGTRGQMFWLKPGLPNSLAPGKRPCDFSDNTIPVATLLLTEQAGRRIPGAVVAIQQPTPIGVVRQHDPHRFR